MIKRSTIIKLCAILLPILLLCALLKWFGNGIGSEFLREIVSESIQESKMNGAFIASYKPIACDDSLRLNLLNHSKDCFDFIYNQRLLFEHPIYYNYEYIFFTKQWIKAKDTCFVYKLWSDSFLCNNNSEFNREFEFKLLKSEDSYTKYAFTYSGKYIKECSCDSMGDTIAINVFGDYSRIDSGSFFRNLGSITYVKERDM